MKTDDVAWRDAIVHRKGNFLLPFFVWIAYIISMEVEIRQKLIDCLRDYFGTNLVSVVSFGSRARGEAKAASDYDLFLVAGELPKRPLERNRFVRKSVFLKFDERISIHAKTKDEFENGFPPLYLDLGVDGQILYDTDNYMHTKLYRIQQIIAEAGLYRIKKSGYYVWEWKKQPDKGWSVTWGGYDDGPR